MVNFTKPPPWNLQPEKTLIPSLWKGCSFLAPLWDLSGKAYGENGIFMPSEKNNYSLTPRPEGFSFYSTDNATNIEYPNQVLPSNFGVNTRDSECCVAVVFNLIQVSGNDIVFTCYNDVDLGGIHILHSFTTNRFQIQFRNTGGGNLIANLDWGSTLTSGELCLLVVGRKYTPSINTGRYAYLFGLESGGVVSQIGQGLNIDFTTANPVSIGASHGGGGSSQDPIFWAGVWNRFLSDDEMNTLRSDPFIMLRPGPLYFSAAAFGDLGAASKFYFGATQINKIYFGSNQISKIYFGSNQVL